MIPISDVLRQYRSIKKEIDSAIQRTLDSGWFILGKEVENFEKEFAKYIGVKYAIGVGSGTEALHIALASCGIKQGDEVITVPNTAVPTVCAITLANATPVFVDIDPDTYTMDPLKLKKKITKRTKAIIPVHLYGHSADMSPILKIAKENGIRIVEDACQAHGSTYKGSKVGSIGDINCFSFYPSKNLGCYGDGGMITTDDPKLFEKSWLLRNYGQKIRYHHITKGFNSRLDEMQAAVLSVKLKYLDKWNSIRRSLAIEYNRSLANAPVIVPIEKSYSRHIYHLYVIRSKKRDKLQEWLLKNQVGTAIHYPIPVHLQKGYKDLRIPKGTYPISEKAANEILSLPLYPELKMSELHKVAKLIEQFKG